MSVESELRLKISLEERFRREVRALFNRIRIEYRVGVSTGRPTRAGAYLSEWTSRLTAQYRRVQNAFRGVVKAPMKQDDNDMVLAALAVWIADRAPVSAEQITDTTQRNMDDALVQARQVFSDEGRFDYTDRELALVAAAILRRKFLGREENIIATETQAAAESTKVIEAYDTMGLAPMSVVTREPAGESEIDGSKQWETVGDNRVRSAHRRASGQTRDVDGLFIVDGQRLLYPGDNSHGATIDNTINCRCSATYSFKGWI